MTIHGANTKSVSQVFVNLFREPRKYLIEHWNWKSALLSSLLRASIFFATNLAAGLPAALAAMQTELVFRALTSGFYGAVTESFCEAEPPWAASITVMLLLPVLNHSVEFLVHWLRGTQRLLPSILASMALTALSTLFNLYIMRRGTLIVGKGRRSLLVDLAQLPRLMLDFVTLVPRHLIRMAARRPNPDPSHAD